MAELMEMSELKKVIKDMDAKRKEDLLMAVIAETFDTFYTHEVDRQDAIIDIIENVTGLDNLNVILYK